MMDQSLRMATDRRARGENLSHLENVITKTAKFAVLLKVC